MDARRIRLCVAIALVCITGAVTAAAFPAATATQTRLPDLGMARLSGFRIEATTDGRLLLRYTTRIVNVGAGPFELRASRPTKNDEFAVSQRLFDDAGGHSDVPTTATMYFAGDGHHHWHVRDLERSELMRLGDTSFVTSSAKHGFCFFDSDPYRLSLPGAPPSRVYLKSGCGKNTSPLALTVGISIGWNDRYQWSLPDQFVDITNVPPGQYRLVSTADAGGWFVESDETNNATWVDLQLKGGKAFTILGYGPSA